MHLVRSAAGALPQAERRAPFERRSRSAALEFLSSLTIEFLFCLTLSTEGVTASHGACDECHTPASSASMQPMFIEEGTTGFTIINNLGRILVRL